MAHITTSVEYGLHCLFWMIGSEATPISIRELAELQVLSPTFLAKIFPKLEKAGIVRASEGVRGGYVLARSPEEITFLEVVDAIEGKKPLFDCQNVRSRCPLYGDKAPGWVIRVFVRSMPSCWVPRRRCATRFKISLWLMPCEVFERRIRPPEFTAAVQKWMDDKIGSAHWETGEAESCRDRRQARAIVMTVGSAENGAPTGPDRR